MIKEQLNNLLEGAKLKLGRVSSQKEFDRLLYDYLGRKGRLQVLAKKIKEISEAERKNAGATFNRVKQELERAFNEKRKELNVSVSTKESIDYTLPGTAPGLGSLHPLTIFIDKIVTIFTRMGFEFVEGNEVETQAYNFDLLNMPKDHPARDMQDTFYIKDNPNWVLRTHVSNVQLRGTATRRPPLRIMYPGRVYRHEATDASHEATFYQFECLVIDEGVTMSQLMGTLKTFFNTLYGDVKIRFRPHYYPFVEPGMDVDMSCLICQQQGCSVCKQSGWLEVLGSGMVHPTVLKNMNISPAKYSGFAFGSGVDRLMMLYYGIDDIRLSYQSDLRFLRQF